MVDTLDPKNVCWRRETVRAKKGSDGKDGRTTVEAACGLLLKNGKCPKHGTDTRPPK